MDKGMAMSLYHGEGGKTQRQCSKEQWLLLCMSEERRRQQRKKYDPYFYFLWKQ